MIYHVDQLLGGNMKVIFEDNHLLVVEKPENIPMQKDSSNDEDLLTLLKKYLKEKYNKPGNVYLGLVHRLDRPVGGVCVFAKTSKAASRLTRMINEHSFKKEYLAIVNDNGLKDKDILIDNLLKDEKTNTVKVDPSGKKAELAYEVIKRKDNLALVHIYLKTGRPHQIRVQFASRDHALWGDQRYNKEAKAKEQIALHSYKLSFNHPVTKERLEFISEINRYPFNI